VEVQRASWEDVVAALELEAETLGSDVAWDLDRVFKWWEAGVETAVVIKDHEQLLAYACAMHITSQAYTNIAEGDLDPEMLELSNTERDSGNYWVGIVIVDTKHRRRGLGLQVLTELTETLEGRFVADVYTDGGRALVETAGWTLLLDGVKPIYGVAKP